ncbi:MAG: RHS repeat protein [Kiritimatiellae bacterium]|nr:RHS repeat protein [Kiritimatiellia bacterium]
MTNLHLFLFFLLFECNVVHSFFVDGFNQKMLINENNLNFVNIESLFPSFFEECQRVFREILPSNQYEVYSLEYFSQNSLSPFIVQLRVKTEGLISNKNGRDFIEVGGFYIMRFYKTNEWSLQREGVMHNGLNRNPDIRRGNFVYNKNMLRYFDQSLLYLFKKNFNDTKFKLEYQGVPFRQTRIIFKEICTRFERFKYSTLAIAGAEQTTTTTVPGVTNPQERVTLDGVTVSETDASGVTQTSDYDVYRRLVSQTDGRNNTTTRMYDAVGRLATVTDAAGAETAYAYDAAGNVSAVTNALGNVIEYAYDVRGNNAN